VKTDATTLARVLDSVARWFEVAPEEVRDAFEFEAGLLAA
jgi:hypothetical protein